METIDEQVIKPILKRTVSMTGQLGFLGELQALGRRPPIAPKKHVCIQEEYNDVGITYSASEYDRSKQEPSTATIQYMRLQHAVRAAHARPYATPPIPIERNNSDMDLVLTENSFSRNQWEMIVSPSSVTGDFRVGEWADMFLSMGHVM